MDRPTTDDVAERDIMLILLVLSGALDRVMGDQLRGRCLLGSARRAGADVGRSNRFVAADGLLTQYGATLLSRQLDAPGGRGWR